MRKASDSSSFPGCMVPIFLYFMAYIIPDRQVPATEILREARLAIGDELDEARVMHNVIHSDQVSSTKATDLNKLVPQTSHRDIDSGLGTRARKQPDPSRSEAFLSKEEQTLNKEHTTSTGIRAHYDYRRVARLLLRHLGTGNPRS